MLDSDGDLILPSPNKDLIRSLLPTILRKYQYGREVLQMQDMLDEIYRYFDRNSWGELIQYFQTELDFSQRLIQCIINQLSINESIKKLYGYSFIKLWLKLKIFQVMRIQPNSQALQRQKVSAIFQRFNFGPNTSLQELIRNCDRSINSYLDEQDIPNLLELITQGKEKQIQRLFSPHLATAYWKRHEFARCVEQYKQLPPKSLEWFVQRETIIKFIAYNRYLKKERIFQEVSQFAEQPSSIYLIKQAYYRDHKVPARSIQQIFPGSRGNYYRNQGDLKSKLIPFNIQKIQRLIYQGERTQHLLEDKDVILILSTAGNKNGSILRLLGYNLKRQKINRYQSLTTMQQLKDEHQCFILSPQGHYQNDFISIAEIPDQMYPSRTSAKKKQFVVCDIPVLHSNQDQAEVDIANHVILQALKQARTIRILVIISKQNISERAFSGFFRLSETIQKYLVTQCVLQSVAACFQTSKDSCYGIEYKHRQLPSVFKDSSQLFSSFLQLLFQSSKDENNFINPLQSDYKSILEMVMQLSPIRVDDQIVKNELNYQTKQQISSFLQSQRPKIIDYLKQARYDEAFFHFRNLKKLSTFLPQSKIIKDCFNQMLFAIRKQCAVRLDQFQQCLILVCQGVDSNQLQERLISSMNRVRVLAQKAAQFEQVDNISLNHAANLIQQYKAQLLLKLQKLNSRNIIKIPIAIRIFTKHLDPQTTNEALSQLANRFNIFYKNIIELIATSKFQRVSIKSIQQIQYITYRLCGSQLFEAKTQQLKQHLLTQARKQLSSLSQLSVSANITLIISHISAIQAILSFSIIEKQQDIAPRLMSHKAHITSQWAQRINSFEGLHELSLRWPQQYIFMFRIYAQVLLNTSDDLNFSFKDIFIMAQVYIAQLQQFINNPFNTHQKTKYVYSTVDKIFECLCKMVNSGQQGEKSQFIYKIQQRLSKVCTSCKQIPRNGLLEYIMPRELTQLSKHLMLRHQTYYLKKALPIIGCIHDHIQKLNQQQQFSVKIASQQPFNQERQKIEQQENQANAILQQIKFFKFQLTSYLTPDQLHYILSKFNQNFSILVERHELFNQFNITSSLQFDQKAIISQFTLKFDQLARISAKQIQLKSKSQNNPAISKIRIFFMVVKVMKDIRFNLIARDHIQDTGQSIMIRIQDEFKRIRQACWKKWESAYNTEQTCDRQLREKKNERYKRIRESSDIYKNRIEESRKEIIGKYTKLIVQQKDGKKEDILQRSKRNQIEEAKAALAKQEQQTKKKIEEEYKPNLDKIQKSLEDSMDELAGQLIRYQKAILLMDYKQSQYKIIEAILAKIAQYGGRHKDYVREYVRPALERNSSDQQCVGMGMTAVYRAFRDTPKKFRDKNIEIGQNQPIKILQNGEANLQEISQDMLKKKFIQFNLKEYFQIPYGFNNQGQMHLGQSQIIHSFINQCKNLGRQIKEQCYQTQHPRECSGTKNKLLSKIFGLWVLLNNPSNKQLDYLEKSAKHYQIQKMALVLLTGMANQSNDNLCNRIVEVSAKEQKSLILAILSTYLTLCGFKVSIACSSDQQKRKNQQEFQQFFMTMGVDDSITYGTIHQITQEVLNRDGVSLEEIVKRHILQGLSLNQIQERVELLMNNRQGIDILLIDEAQTVLDKNYLGEMYCPTIKLKDPAATRLIEHIWKQVSSFGADINYYDIQRSEQLQQLNNKFPTLSTIFESQLHGMVSGAHQYRHQYITVDKKVSYNHKDTTKNKDNICFSYKTIFANLCQHYKGNVSRSHLDQVLYIPLTVGQFSYTRLLTCFRHIMGVTTKVDASQRVVQYLRRNLIINNNYKLLPKKQQRNSKPVNYILTQSQQIHETIVSKIKMIQQNRPMIIFFTDENQASDFYHSPVYQPFRMRTSIIAQRQPAWMQDFYIARAFNTNAITFTTRQFKNITSFQQIRDVGEQINWHAISTCFSDDVYLNDCGSYDCILIKEQIKALNNQSPPFTSISGMNPIISQIKQAKMKIYLQSKLKSQQRASRRHDDTLDLYRGSNLQQTQLIQYLNSLNTYPNGTNKIKVILALDATLGMGATLSKMSNIIEDLFERTNQVLKYRYHRASVEIKIIAFRNYDCPYNRVVQSSPYESTPRNLVQFTKRLEPMGGLEGAAFELLFNEIQEETRLDHVIVISSSRLNSSDDFVRMRSKRGEDYWNLHEFPIIRLEEQFGKFQLKSVPVNCCQLDSDTELKHISLSTGGKLVVLRTNRQKYQEDITHFITQGVLRSIENELGIRTYGRDLAEDYRTMFA